MEQQTFKPAPLDRVQAAHAALAAATYNRRLGDIPGTTTVVRMNRTTGMWSVTKKA